MANRPKGKLFALLAIFVAIGLITATGAFTSVQAQRTMTVSVAGDGSALLGLADAGQGYVNESGDTITIDFGNNGVNINADTDFGAVLNVTNNGASTVNVQIATHAANTSFTSTNLFEDDHSLDPEFTDASGNNIEGGDVDSGGNQITLTSGASADVHVTISVPAGQSPGSFSGDIVIVASTNDLTA